MDLEQIKTFVAVAHLASFRRAAESLHRSQPAISRRIELLERTLGVPLLERTRGGVILTDAGAALIPFAQAMLAAVQDGIEAVAELRKGESGRISLALVGTLANAESTDLLKKFHRQHPKVRLDLQTATSQSVGELVLRGEATLGLRYLADPRPGLRSQIIGHEEMLVVCSPEHRLADGRRHLPRELEGERWVAFSSSRTPRDSLVQLLERKLIAAGLASLDILPVDGLTAQKRLVEAGFGIALLARSAIQEELRSSNLKVLDIPALAASIPIVVVHRRNGYLSPAAQGLLAMMAARAKPARGGLVKRVSGGKK